MTKLRLQHHGARDRDALALAAGEFVRIAVARSPDRARPRSSAVATVRVALGAESAGSWIFSPSATISATDMRGRQRAVRILEDDLHFAPQRPHRGSAARRCRGREDDAALATRSAAAARGRASSCPSRDSPTTPSVCPARTVTSTPSTALTWPTVVRQKPALDREPDLEVVGLASRSARRVGGAAACPSARRRADAACIHAAAARRPRSVGPVSTILPFGHHADAVGDLAHDAEVVGDEQHRHARRP